MKRVIIFFILTLSALAATKSYAKVSYQDTTQVVGTTSLAKSMTDSLHIKLNFTDSQYKKIYKLIYKEAALINEKSSAQSLQITVDENNKKAKKFLKPYQYTLFIQTREKWIEKTIQQLNR